MVSAIWRGFFSAGVLALLTLSARADYSLENWAALQNWPDSAAKMATTDFTTPWPDYISLGKDGFFMVATGSFGLFDIFEMRADGACAFVFFDRDAKPPVWRKAAFRVSDEVVRSTLDSLSKTGLKRLHKSYSVTAEDGEQAFLSISDGSDRRTVWMDNTFPPEFQKIINLARDMIANQRPDLNSAPLSTQEESRALYHKALP